MEITGTSLERVPASPWSVSRAGPRGVQAMKAVGTKKTKTPRLTALTLPYRPARRPDVRLSTFYEEPVNRIARATIPKGSRQQMSVTAGTRTIHVFGGQRARRKGEAW